MKEKSNEIQKLKDKTFILSLNIDKNNVQKEYQHVLTEIQASFETKGFRKGKAPLNVVEQHMPQQKLTEEVISHLVSHIYSEKIKEHDLKPIIQPQIRIKNPPITFDKNWELEITGCELPEIELNSKVFDEIKKINLEEIKTKSKSKPAATPEQNKLDKVLDVLVNNAVVELPPILIDADVENRLSQLVEQTSQAGLSIQQYLKSRNQTLEQYQEDLKQQITKEWKLNLSIDKIAKEQNIEIKEQEVKDMLTKMPQLSSNINLVYYFLTQQKVFDYLQNLK